MIIFYQIIFQKYSGEIISPFRPIFSPQNIAKILYKYFITNSACLQHVREGFVLDFCPTFRILSFVTSCKNLRSPFTKQLTGLFCSLRSNPCLYSQQSKNGTPFGVPSCFGGERGIRTLVCLRTN